MTENQDRFRNVFPQTNIQVQKVTVDKPLLFLYGAFELQYYFIICLQYIFIQKVKHTHWSYIDFVFNWV